MNINAEIEIKRGIYKRRNEWKKQWFYPLLSVSCRQHEL